MIARSKNFWKYFYPIFKQFSPDQFKDIDFENWYRQVNMIRPNFIRVEADELTYSLHVILRFEIENKLMNDEIKVSNLPSIWNEKMKEMLDITPPTDKEGVLQDMHWSGGSIGYFPTYAIGSIYSSQIYKKISEINPNMQNEIEQGNFGNILNWLRENIHKYGRLFTADEIIKNACGEGLNSKVYVDYLKEKYYTIYDIS